MVDNAVGKVVDGRDTGVGLTFICVGGSLGVQVKMCRDKIPQLMIVAEDSTLLINGGCCMWAITSAKISIHVSSKNEDSIV